MSGQRQRMKILKEPGNAELLLHRSIAFLLLTVLFLNPRPLYAQWVQSGGFFPAPLRCIASQSDTCYAYPADGAVVYRSSDGGKFWAPLPQGPGHIVTLYPCKSGLLALCDSGVFSYREEFGWSQLLRWKDRFQTGAVISPSDSILLVATHFVYRSSDGGHTWVEVDSTYYDYSTCFTITDSVVLVGHQYYQRSMKVTRSTDGGLHWVCSDSGMTRKEVNSVQCLLADTNATLILAGTNAGIFASTDEGLSWFESDSGLITPPSLSWPGVSALSHIHNLFYAATSAGLFSSADGSHWGLVESAAGLPPIGNIIGLSSGLLFVGQGSGLFSSTDKGSTWNNEGEGLPYAACSVSAFGRLLFLLTCADFYGSLWWLSAPPAAYRSLNGGSSWELAQAGLGNHALLRQPVAVRQLDTASQTISLHLFAPIYKKGVVANSADTGATWTLPQNTPLSDVIASIGVQMVNPSLPLVYAGGRTWYPGDDIPYNFAFLSWDMGQTWQHRFGDYGSSYNRGGVSEFVSIGEWIFLCSSGSIFRSSDAGVSWVRIDTVYASDQFFGKDSSLFAMSGGKVLRSTDLGRRWTAVLDIQDSTGQPGGALSSANDLLFFSGQRATTMEPLLLYSPDNGSSWKRAEQGLPKDFIGALTAVGDTLYVGTQHSGMWRRSLTELVTSVQSRTAAGVPEQCALGQNWPNPFNPSTTIGYTVGGTGDWGVGARNVKLSVYNLLGQEVAVLVNEQQAPGRYTVRFDGSHLASGMYLYRLQAGNYLETKRMLLLK